MSEPTTPQRREIGFWTATSLVIGSMIGSGVFLLPASLAPYGGISLLGWVVTAFGSIMLALSLAVLARRNPAAGGLYAYTRDSFGEFAGFLVAWGYWISMWSANAAIAVAFAGYAGPLLSAFVPGVPDVSTTPTWGAILAVGAVWVLTGVNALGVRAAGRVQVVTTVIKLLPLVIVGIAGMVSFEPARFAIPESSPFGASLFAVMTLTLFAFLGLEAATIPAASVKDPDRTIPRATIVGTLATAAVYIISTAAVMSLVAPEVLKDSTEPFAEAARTFSGEGLARFIGVGAAISTFGALNGWILVVSQLQLAVARDGVFPGIFAKVNRQGTPVVGMVIAAVLASGLVYLNYSGEQLTTLYEKILLLSTLSTLIPYSFCAMAVFLPGGRRGPVPAGAMTVAGLAFIFSCFAIYGAGAETVFLGFLLIITGVPVYVWVIRAKGAAARS